MTATPERLWRHLTDVELLAGWWAPDDLRISEFVFEARPGGRIVQEYRDADDIDGSDVVVGRAEGEVTEVRVGEHLAYRLSPLLPGGGVAFTGLVELDLRATPDGVDLDVHYRVIDSTADAADFVAGIEIGFGQSLDKLTTVIDGSPQ